MRQPVSSILRQKPPQLHALGPESSVDDAVRLMNRYNVGAVLVMDPDQRLLGIFTERDVLRRVIDGRLDYEGTRLAEVMTSQVRTITPETTVEDALTIVDRYACRHLPVTRGDQVIGMISLRDLTGALVADRESEIQQLTGYISGRY
ncbi:CBS domain-containing protein [Arhodomonas sp. AD133]|uniref:CBS domain-containing protein n=1 Tax=Arhodomonas sp. AD133 TaxID=3415009 RepID=UPI003EB75F78